MDLTPSKLGSLQYILQLVATSLIVVVQLAGTKQEKVKDAIPGELGAQRKGNKNYYETSYRYCWGWAVGENVGICS
jgi:hypothetical protein